MSFLAFANFIAFTNIITLVKWWLYKADTFSYAKDIKILFVSKCLLVSLLLLVNRLNIAVTARSMACTYRSSLAVIVESNPARTQKFVSYECCVLSCRGLCVGLIICPEESYLMWCFQCVWERFTVREGYET